MSFDRRVTPFRPDLADRRLQGQVAAERFVAGSTKRVNATSAPVRAQPSSEAALTTEALMGELVTIYDDHEGWAWGQLQGDGYVGYLQSALLDEPGPDPTHRVAAIRTFVYPGPNMKLPTLTHLSINSRVTVTDVEGDYARLASGGWVFAAHLIGADVHQSDYVSVAERLVGTPYLWGGKTSLGLDCSGLAQMALLAAGIRAPRDSDMQERDLGAPVEARPDLSGLQRGDLVFWKGHVGLMLDAATLIHATGHSMTVLVEPLATAEERIRTKSYGPITSIKRLRPGG